VGQAGADGDGIASRREHAADEIEIGANVIYEDAVLHAQRWIDAWNSHDLELILSHYADDVEFEAQTVVGRWNKPDGKLHGIAELRKHFALGLELVPDLKFMLEQVFVTPSGYAVLYRRDNGNRVIDAVVLNAEGKAAKVTAYYASVQR